MIDDNHNLKKIVLCTIGFIVIVILFFGFKIYNSLNKELNYFYVYNNLESISFLNEKDITTIQNNIFTYLTEDLDYVSGDISSITFQNRTYENKNKIYFFFKLDDEMQSLYGTSYDNKKHKFNKNIIWFGDCNNKDYINEAIPYSYLYITDYNEWQKNNVNNETEAFPPDEDNSNYDY